jgi:hypothetical protein
MSTNVSSEKAVVIVTGAWSGIGKEAPSFRKRGLPRSICIRNWMICERELFRWPRLRLWRRTKTWPSAGSKSLPVVSVPKIERGLEARAVASLTGIDALVAPLPCGILLSAVNRHGLVPFWRNLKCLQNGIKRVARCHWCFSCGAFKSMAERGGFEPPSPFWGETA